MSSKLARSAVGLVRLRPTAPSRALPATLTPLTTARFESNVPQQDPKKAAQSILDSVPGSSIASKTAILSAGAGLSIAAISNELFVVNEEAVVAFSLLSIFFAVFKYGGPMYKQWAENQNAKIKNILNSAREEHTQAVQTRIDSVKELGGVVDITKDLFAVSKETAELEARIFELEQTTALAKETKDTLDSWVRYEGQVRARQQQELADAVIAKIDKELENPKVLKQILDQSVQEVERLVAQPAK